MTMLKLMPLLLLALSVLDFEIFTRKCLAATKTDENGINESYEGSTVFKIHPKDPTEVDFLHSLMLTETQLDFWIEPQKTGDTVKFLAPKESIGKVKQKLDSVGISYEESDQELLKELRQDPVALRHRSLSSGEIDLETFNNLNDISVYLQAAEARCPRRLKCLLYSIGKSFEGRDILVFKISEANATERKGFWIDATIHAREWLSTATALKILDHLLNQRDANSRRLLAAYDWYIAPVLNPDGYVHTFTERLWRKNRRIFANSSCIGVDLNRNFAFRWGHEGAQQNPCFDTNCGPNSGSEPEVKAVQRETVRLGATLLSYVTLHAFGRMWMFPYGNTVDYEGEVCERTTDYEDLMDVANAAADAAGATYKTKWRRGTTCEVVYPNSGSSLDYIKFTAGVKYTYALEIRGDGFSVDPSEILPSFIEVWNGLVVMCDVISAKSSGSSSSSFSSRNSSQQKMNSGGTLFASLLFRWLRYPSEF